MGIDWTDERVETLCRLARAGHSSSVIARHMGLGLTRNAVIGKLFRLPDHLKPVRRPQSPVMPVVVKAQRLAPPIKAKPVERPAPAPEPVGPPVKPDTEGARLMDIATNGCRWVTEDAPRGGMSDAIMCAAPKRQGSSFCAWHHQIAFLPFTRSAMGKRRFQLGYGAGSRHVTRVSS